MHDQRVALPELHTVIGGEVLRGDVHEGRVALLDALRIGYSYRISCTIATSADGRLGGPAGASPTTASECARPLGPLCEAPSFSLFLFLFLSLSLSLPRPLSLSLPLSQSHHGTHRRVAPNNTAHAGAAVVGAAWTAVGWPAEEVRQEVLVEGGEIEYCIGAVAAASGAGGNGGGGVGAVVGIKGRSQEQGLCACFRSFG